MTKNELRTCFKQARQDFVLSMNSMQISGTLDTLQAHLNTAQIVLGTIGGYAAMTSEIDPLSLLEPYKKKGHRIALPWFKDRDAGMLFKISDGELERGPFGILQPRSENPVVEPDTKLVPLIAADIDGNRLGQGQGHFDRFLSKSRSKRSILTIGLAWECQIADQLPADSWDEPLDYIATPDRLIKVTS
jgi:5-formyltetrahydrofolate cyclo-ligase